MITSKDELQRRLKVLGKKHTMEILAHIQKGSKYITQIARETKIPYTTVQHRVTELENVGLVRIVHRVDEDTGKAIKVIRVSNFRISLTPQDIERLVEKKGEKWLSPKSYTSSQTSIDPGDPVKQ
ncbi:MAG: winged helix-turn-helix domain-containing protein [Candidatus Bathyarchaeota archaeon]|nr:winged helix-turn-helix domain-containing protein [Candidatus Bathyarchaeota archaeon]